MKKLVKNIMTIALLVAIFIPVMQVSAAGSISVSASSKSLNIGDTVTITAEPKGPGGETAYANLSFVYDSTKLSFVSCSKSVYGGGAGGVVNVTGSGTDRVSITLKAIAPGDAGIQVDGKDAVSVSDASNEFGMLSSGKTTVSIKNAVTEEENNGGGTTGGATGGGEQSQGNKSADNSLKSLKISPGTLSPTFKYSTVNYRATVGADVTSIAVDAKPSNAKAVVESVTGNNNLKVGKNTIKVVVKAENGTLATYTIIVTKEAATTEEPTTNETPENTIEINGINYTISSKLPEDVVPGEFTKSTTIYNEQEIEAYSFPYEDFVLLYLTPADTAEATGEFYFYSAARNAFFPYIKITVGQKYVLLLPSVFAGGTETTQWSEFYEEALIVIGKFSVNGYQWKQDKAEGKNQFYLVYGVDNTGAAGWYQYDVVDMSAQRHHETTYIEETDTSQPTTDTEAYEIAYSELNKQYTQSRIRTRIIIAVMAIITVAAIAAMVCAIIFAKRYRKKRKQQDEEIEYIDFDNMIQ